MNARTIVLGVIAMAPSVFSQGIITFYNNNIINPNTGAAYRAGIYQWDGDVILGNSTIGAGAGFTAGLFLLNSTTPLATTTFRTTTAPEVFATTQDVTIPGTLPGQSVELIIKAWSTAAGSYEAARNDFVNGWQWGEQQFTSKPLGGPNPNPPPPSFFTPDIAPFTGFETHPFIPEPSTLALGVFGIGALVVRKGRPRHRSNS